MHGRWEEVEAAPGLCAWHRGAQARGLRAARLTRWRWIVVATCWMVATATLSRRELHSACMKVLALGVAAVPFSPPDAKGVLAVLCHEIR